MSDSLRLAANSDAVLDDKLFNRMTALTDEEWKVRGMDLALLVESSEDVSTAADCYDQAMQCFRRAKTNDLYMVASVLKRLVETRARFFGDMNSRTVSEVEELELRL